MLGFFALQAYFIIINKLFNIFNLLVTSHLLILAVTVIWVKIIARVAWQEQEVIFVKGASIGQLGERWGC